MRADYYTRLAAIGSACLAAVCFLRYGPTFTVGASYVVKLMGALVAGGLSYFVIMATQVFRDDRREPLVRNTLLAVRLRKERMLAAMNELAFDHALGKLDDSDHQYLRSKYEQKALRALREVDEAERPALERAEKLLSKEKAKREKEPAKKEASTDDGQLELNPAFCIQCGAKAVKTALFCFACGHKLEGESE